MEYIEVKSEVEEVKVNNDWNYEENDDKDAFFTL